MRSKIAIAGHPLHPALVALPVGLLVWALFANIVFVISDDNRMWYNISFWSGIAGVVTALVAALPGFGDYFLVAIHTEARAIATAHMLLNLSVVALFVVVSILMRDHNALRGGMLTTAIVLQAIGVGLLGLSGWLGGEMVFREHLGMVADDAERERAETARHSLEHAAGAHH